MENLVNEIKDLTTGLVANLDLALKGNKSAGARARKASLVLEKKFKEFRRVSVEAERKK